MNRSLISRLASPWKVLSKNGASSTVEEKAYPASGVSFIGAPDFTKVIYLGAPGAMPDAERLSKYIAITTSAYAYVLMNYRATKMAEPPLMVVQETENGIVPIEHDLDAILRDPSPDYDMGDLQQITEYYRLCTGECIWVKVLDSFGNIARLIPFSGDEFETESTGDLIYGLYRLTKTKKATRREYLPEEVIHFRDIHPNTWRHGLSKLEVALADLDLGHQVSRTVRNFMLKAMFPGGVISSDKDWKPDDDEWEQFKGAIEAWFQGPKNAGEPLVLAGGTSFSRAAIPLKELLPKEILDRVESRTSAVFGVPPVLVGFQIGLENSPWSNFKEARRTVYEETFEPRWTDTEKRLTKGMLSQEEQEAGMMIRYDTSEIRALQDDEEQKAKVAALMRREWTLDERRIFTGKEPVGSEAGGDDVEGPGLLQSLGVTSVEEATALLKIMNDGGHVLPAPHDSKGLLAALEEEMKGASKEYIRWAMFDISTKASESRWEREVSKGLERQQREIVKIAQGKLTEKQIGEGSAADFIKEVEAWLETQGNSFMRALLYPLLVSTGEQGVKAAATGLGLSFSRLEPGLIRFAEREAAFLSEVLGKTTGKEVAKIVQKGLEEGDLIRDLTKRLDEAFAFGRTRATRIARTETTRAWNGSSWESISDYNRSTRAQVIKQWLNSQDDRVRDEHTEAGVGGEKQLVDVAFSNGLMYPGEPNCRCTLIYEILEEE